MFKYLNNRQYNHNFSKPNPIYSISKDSQWLIQRMALYHLMEAHRGCVNTVVWDEKGEFLLSGSDDQHLVISDPWQRKQVENLPTGHSANIFSAKFLPETCNQKIVSCSGDGTIFCTDLDGLTESKQNKFNCHTDACYDVITVPACPNLFLSCGEDGTVRWFDLRMKSSCHEPHCKQDILLNMGQPVTAIALNTVQQHHIAVASQDSMVRIYDRRMLGTRAQDSYLDECSQALLMRMKPANMDSKGRRVTSMKYNSTGTQVLVSYSSENLYLFDTENFCESQQPKEVEDSSREVEEVCDSGPTLKRLRLRGDWSDTGPQAVPESELRYQAGDVGQARPALHTTLMQRMTDILSRMLETRSTTDRRSSSTETPSDSVPANPTSPEDQAVIEPAGQSTSREGIVSGETSSGTDDTPVVPSADIDQGIVPNKAQEPCATNRETGDTLSSPPSTSAAASTTQELQQQSSLNTGISTFTNQLTEMRDSFKERYAVEPAVDIIYSGQGTSPATLRMGVGNEVTRQSPPRSANPTETSASEADHAPAGGSQQPPASAMLPGPSTSAGGVGESRPRKRPSPDADSSRTESVEVNRHRTTSSRMARAIDKVVYRVRKSEARRLDGSPDKYVPRGREIQRFKGHRNARTMIKECNFWGEKHVICGSDCGRIFVWEKDTGRLVKLWEADRHVVNCLQPHPTLPILASSGIDYDVKLWAPCSEEAEFDEEKAQEITRRNEALLAETRDTITVPATFMIRMLASLNQLRQERSRSRNQSVNEDEN